MAPKLTVNILTRDSEDRLERLLSEVSSFADEVLVGVDVASVDRTLEIASARADVVYRFRHFGQPSPARMLPFKYATGDWILSLDDDESIEASFDALLPSLLTDVLASHYWFPRKWIVSLDPCEYLHAPPWFPDWQLRLFRNDPSLIWKPARPHSGYCAQGPGYYDTRACILHFEPLQCDADARDAKLRRYRERGGSEHAEVLYSHPPQTVRRGAVLRPQGIAPLRRRRRILHETVHDLTMPSPPWQSIIAAVEMPAVATVGETLLAEIHATNTGAVSWAPFYGGRSAQIQIGYHLLDSDGQMIQRDLPRCAVLRFVAPGESAMFLFTLDAPSTAGDYLLEWDLVSEHECWFADCGGTVLRTPLHVT